MAQVILKKRWEGASRAQAPEDGGDQPHLHEILLKANSGQDHLWHESLKRRDLEVQEQRW